MSDLANPWDDTDEVVDARATSDLTVVADAESSQMTEDERELANEYGLNLDEDVAHLIRDAAIKTSKAQHMMVESGLLLLSAHSRLCAERTTKKDNANPEFKALLMEHNLPKERAYELMRIARYISGLQPEQREEMMGLSKKKLLEFAKTDLEVLDQMILEGEEFDFKEANYDATRQRIKEVQAKLAQASVELKKSEAENAKLQNQLKAATASRSDMTDIVPPHVSDIRLEVAALFKKAELSIDGIARLIHEAHMLDGEWALSTARSIFAALTSLITQAKGPSAELHKAYGANLDGDHSTLERLTQKELFKCATEFRELIGEHEHEAALRAYERDLDKPKGKGRPKAAPTKDAS